MAKITMSREAWLKPLVTISGALDKKPLQPILNHVLLKGAGNTLTFVATDTEIELQSIATVENSNFDGLLLTVPGKKLLDICRSLPENQPITLTESGNKVTITCGKSRFSLATLPADTFPIAVSDPTEISFTCPQETLTALIKKTSFAIPQQEVRRYLNGLLLELDHGVLRALATDSHRLATSIASFAIASEDFAQVIVPKKTISELARLLEAEGDATLTFGNRTLTVKTDSFSLVTQLINGKFPNYHKIIPELGKLHATLPTEALKQALVRVSILSSELFRSVCFNFKPQQLVLSANTELEEAVEELAITYAGPEISLVFNFGYFLDILNATVAEQIDLYFNEIESGITIKEAGSEASTFILMPIRK